MKFLLAVLCVLPLISADPAATSSPKCIVLYLKNRGFLGGTNQTLQLTPKCTQVVNQALTASEEKFRKRFSSDAKTANKVDCIMQKLKKTDTLDRDLLEYLDMSKAQVDAETIAQSESAGILANILNVVKALISCEVDSQFDDAFIAGVNETYHNLFNKDEKYHIKNDFEDYCVRKYVVDHDLISFNKKSFKQNPREVNPAAVNCNIVYADHTLSYEQGLIKKYLGKDKIETEADQKWANCFTRIMRQNKYVDQMQQFYYVKGLSLNNEKNADKKEALRLIFIELVMNIAKTAKKCEVPDGFAAL